MTENDDRAPAKGDTRATIFHALPLLDRVDATLHACDWARTVFESEMPEEGLYFSFPDALVFETLHRDFAARVIHAVRAHRRSIGTPLADPLGRLCSDLDLAISRHVVRFDDVALEWATYALMNLGLAAGEGLSRIEPDEPFRDPWLLCVNQAITAVAFHRAKKAGRDFRVDSEPLSKESIDPIISEWWTAAGLDGR